LNVGSPLANDFENLIPSISCRESMALHDDVDKGLAVVIVNDLVLIGLGQLDLGASLLLERLDCGTTLANDECSTRLGNRDLDSNLLDGKKE
jgi:hypothetical protein